VQINHMTYDSHANYICDAGFVLIGSTRRTCQATGMWSTEVIICASKEFESSFCHRKQCIK